MKFLKQKGVISPLILVAIIGVIIFILVSSTLSFKDGLFGTLYPKPHSYAVSDINGAIFSLNTTSTNILVPQEVPVAILMRSDTHKANLVAAKINFDASKLEVVRIETTGTFVTQWVDRLFNNTTGKVSVVGAVPKPGFSTSGSDALVATVIFRTKLGGLTNVSFEPTSAIYRNSDNVNFLTTTNNLNLTIQPIVSPSPSPTVVPSPTPTPTASVSPSPSSSPAPTACSLTGATWATTSSSVNEGEIVTLNVLSQGNCLNKTVSIEIREDDGLLGSDPVLHSPSNITFNNNSSSTSWVAEYQPDGFNGLNDPPEFYFIATLLSDSTTITSTLPNLSVIKLPTTVYRKGDANRDSRVDLQDLSILLSYWFDTTNFPDEIDINDDGVINTFDFSGLLVILSDEGVIGAL
jgi:hypothetical protein